MRTLLATLLALAAMLNGCAHAEKAAAGPPAPAPVWPGPPAPPRVRWVASFLAPGSERQERSWLGRVADAVLGVESREEAAASPSLLTRPFGIAMRGDEVVVADPDGAQVLLLDARTGTHRLLECPSRPWVAPSAVALAPDGSRYVADAAGILVRLPMAGGCALLGEGRLTRPTGVAWLDGRVWTVDPPAHVLVAFTPDGRELLRVGGLGTGAGQLHFPSAVAAAPDGTLLVVDALNFRVVRFAADGSALAAFGGPGEEAEALGRPKAVATTSGGRILVTDALSDQVKVFAADGDFELAFGGSGSEPGQLILPAGIAVAGRRVLVCDSGNRRVSVYELEQDT